MRLGLQEVAKAGRMGGLGFTLELPEEVSLPPPSMPFPQRLCFNGEKFKGRYTIAQQFHRTMRQVAGAGENIVFVVDALDFQELGGTAVSGVLPEFALS